ncbi:hypothetical protein D3C84_667830 [compost metagenome]
MVYAGARYYDPVIGRFLAVDPASVQEDVPSSFNRYAYANNGPYRYVDPDGRMSDDINERKLTIGLEGAVYVTGGGSEIGPINGVRRGVLPQNDFAEGMGRVSAPRGSSHKVSEAVRGGPEIAAPYKRPSGATTVEQRASVQGRPCVDCGAVSTKQVADHKTPLVKEYYQTGGIDKIRMRSVDAIQPQCPTCSARQGAAMSRYSQQMKKELDLD